MTTFTTCNPTTAQALATWTYLNPADTEAALARASAAAHIWRRKPLAERAQVVQAVARALEENRTSIAASMTEEMGKPILEAEAEIRKCAWVCQHYAEQAPVLLQPRIVAAAAPYNEVQAQPLGVILSVLPWNFPAWQLFRFAAPAWMAGNAVLMKHAPNTFGTADALARVCHDAGLPAGLLVDLRIDTPDVPGVIHDRRVAAVTLTGSERAGRAVAAQAGEALKKCVLELGGSDPFIVLDDADLPAAIAAATTSRCLNNGQSCIAAKRFIVHNDVHDVFVRGLTTAMAALRMGDPRDPTTQLGPLARADLVATLHRQVTESVAAGAHVALGGTPSSGPGFFYPPTILVDVPSDCAAANEELFGPVAAVFRCASDADAVRMANQTNYGLSAAVWTQSTERARAIADQIDAGSVFVNQFSYSDPRLPFGGVKDSGHGRELGTVGLFEFVNTKTYSVRPAGSPSHKTE